MRGWRWVHFESFVVTESPMRDWVTAAWNRFNRRCGEEQDAIFSPSYLRIPSHHASSEYICWFYFATRTRIRQGSDDSSQWVNGVPLNTRESTDTYFPPLLSVAWELMVWCTVCWSKTLKIVPPFFIQSKSILKKKDRFESGTDSESRPKNLHVSPNYDAHIPTIYPSLLLQCISPPTITWLQSRKGFSYRRPNNAPALGNRAAL